MKAIFIRSEGAYLQATLEINGLETVAMDEFGGENCRPGQEVDVDISVGLNFEGESWESIFSGNPEAKRELQQQSGWSYRAFGVVISIKPEVLVDVGFTQLHAPISTNDGRVVGANVAFTIDRLDAYASDSRFPSAT